MNGRYNDASAAMRRRRRSGSVMIWCALLLPVLLAMVGLVIDGGLTLAAYREAHNAADAAALAGAEDLMRGRTVAQATATAKSYVTSPTYNDLSDAAVTVHIPPQAGHYIGKANYVEVVVASPYTTKFLQVLPGFNRDQTVTARAVAGIEPKIVAEGVMTLSSTGNQALWLSGNGSLVVNGTVQVNSSGTPAIRTDGNGTVVAQQVDVVGDARGTNIQNLQTGASAVPDLLAYLPTPTVSNGVPATDTSPSNGTYHPGVYPSGIKYSGNGAVTLMPGIYVLTGGGLDFGKATSVTGNGVMFYVTGSTYNRTTGGADASDPVDPMNSFPPSTSGTTFASISLDASKAPMTLSPIDSSKYSYGNSNINIFDGMLVYYRRDNPDSAMKLTGTGGANNLTGTFYAKWGTLTLAGGGTFSLQFVVNSLRVTGGGNMTINYTGQNYGKAPQVFLVE